MFSFLRQKLSFQSPFESKLTSTSLLDNKPALNLEDLLFLIDIFEGKYQFQGMPWTGNQYLKLYFEILQKEYKIQSNIRDLCDSSLKKLKSLLVIHLIINEFTVGSKVAENFLQTKIKWCYEAPIDTQDQMIQGYFQYLQKMASSVQVYHSCKIHQFPLGQGGVTLIDAGTKLIWLFKIINLINCTDIFIKQQLTHTIEDQILKEIFLILWNDIIVLYNFLCSEIIDYIDNYQKLQYSLCLQYYELIVEQIKIQEKVLQIYKLRVYFDKEKVIKMPKTLNIPKVTMSMIQDYVFQAKLNINTNRLHSSRDSLNRQMGGYNTSRNIQSDALLSTLVNNNLELTGRNSKVGRAQKTDENFKELLKIVSNNKKKSIFKQ